MSVYLHPRAIVGVICEEFSVEKDSILKRGAKRNKARDIAIYLSRNNCGIGCKPLGEYFGNVSGSAITMAYNRIEKNVNQNKRFKGKVNKLNAYALSS